jgi:hypothetical protein
MKPKTPLKQAEKLIETLNRITNNRGRFLSQFKVFIETAKDMTLATFPVKGISIDVTEDSTEFDLSFNKREFKVLFTDNPQKGCGEVKVHRIMPDSELEETSFIEFTFNGQGVTDLQHEPREDVYSLAAHGEAICILLNIIDEGMNP